MSEKEEAKLEERRGSTGNRGVSFSCCSKPRQQSPDHSPLGLPSKGDSTSPPLRPPKVRENDPPPSLPPRSDSISGTLTRKPPLPPNSSQEVALKNGYLSLSREACINVGSLCERLGQVAAQCNADQAHGGGSNIDEDKFQEAKEALTMEVRKLVTSSKMLVRSSSTANMSTTSLPEFQTHLSSCISLLRRLTELSTKMATHTASPLHTRNLVLKVQDVVAVFQDLLATEGQETQLTKQAENLASVLATLLRSLRVFTP
uniref:Uncharacterized protein n=2 Tax=Clastoptera arizonana TaxID=38151 RepID=A0A1B6DRG2_9HEMI